jgi:hypothetical protein
MAGSSPAIDGSVFGTVPALRSGMKNAAPRPGHEFHSNLRLLLPRRIAENGRTLRHIAGNHGAGPDHGIVADG